jgi:alpha-glucuronidase
MGWNHHYGPAPWIKDKERADWTSVYYHRADAQGIGFDRSSRGSNALGQYHPPVQALYDDLQQCPESYLLWFHHVPWSHTMRSGRTLWDELCYTYQQGVQHQEATWWRDACLLYFQQFSKQPLPTGIPRPARTLEDYQRLEFPYAPGIRPKW